MKDEFQVNILVYRLHNKTILQATLKIVVLQIYLCNIEAKSLQCVTLLINFL